MNLKIVGLIVEYNPFHNGHLHHIEESLRITGADTAIVVMSGNFVQRGAPALMPKHLRTEIALHAGVSLVLELPVRYATGSAEYFAQGAVSTLHALGCVDSICFGSECGNIEQLTTIADILVQEPPRYQEALQEQLRSGKSYPVARQLAMAYYLEQLQYDTPLVSILADPNNILGIEYIKALRRIGSSMVPRTIPRVVSHYHDTHLQETYSSASAIRSKLQQDLTNWELLSQQMPLDSHQQLTALLEKRFPVYTNDFSLLLHNQLLRETKETLLTYADMTEELANRILKNRNSFLTFEQFCACIHTKNLTYARVSRVLLHILLNIHSTEVTVPYLHVLGFRRTASSLLTIIKAKGTAPLVTKLTTVTDISPEGQQLLAEDLYAANLYEAVITHKFQTNFIHEYEQSILLV